MYKVLSVGSVPQSAQNSTPIQLNTGTDLIAIPVQRDHLLEQE